MRATGESQIGYFLAGMGVGVAIGMLFAPRSGRETREYIRERAEEGTDYLKRQAGELRKTGEEALERGAAYAGRQDVTT